MTVVRRTKREMNAMDKGNREEFLTIEDKIAEAREWLRYKASSLLRRFDEEANDARTVLIDHQARVGSDPIYAMERADAAMTAAAKIDYHERSGAGLRCQLIDRDLGIVMANTQDPRLIIVLAHEVQALYRETVNYASRAQSGASSSSPCTRTLAAEKSAYALHLTSSFGVLSQTKDAADTYLRLFLERAVG